MLSTASMTPCFVQDDTTTFQSDWIQQHDVDAQNVLKMPVSTVLLFLYVFCGYAPLLRSFWQRCRQPCF